MRHVTPGLFLGEIALLLSFIGALEGCSNGDEGINISQAGAGGAVGGSSGTGGSLSGSGGGNGGGSATGGSATGGSATGGNGGSAGMATCTPVFDAGVPPDLDAGADAGDGGPVVSNGPVGFAADVYPILQANCGPCHTTDYSGGHNVASSDEAEAYGFAQTLGGRILERVNGGGMPPTCSGYPGDPGCLSFAEVELIRRWTAQCFPP